MNREIVFFLFNIKHNFLNHFNIYFYFLLYFSQNGLSKTNIQFNEFNFYLSFHTHLSAKGVLISSNGII
jgi:hypothetical protein